jgi:copper chaperone CopZ
MKNILIIPMILFAISASAQIQSVTLQAGGLTCSMCSRAIYKSLQKVPGVIHVDEDIEHSSYHVKFSDPSKVSPEALKTAVKDAGFSIVRLELLVSFDQAAVMNDSTIRMGNLDLQFVKPAQKPSSGNHQLLIIDKDYLLDKDRIAYPGNPEAGSNWFHVTLEKS